MSKVTSSKVSDNYYIIGIMADSLSVDLPTQCKVLLHINYVTQSMKCLYFVKPSWKQIIVFWNKFPGFSSSNAVPHSTKENTAGIWGNKNKTRVGSVCCFFIPQWFISIVSLWSFDVILCYTSSLFVFSHLMIRIQLVPHDLGTLPVLWFCSFAAASTWDVCIVSDPFYTRFSVIFVSHVQQCIDMYACVLPVCESHCCIRGSAAVPELS